MAKITKAAKKAKIQEMLEKSDLAVCRAIVSIYERQTAEEQAAAVTVNDNGVGFSGCDAEFGSSLAQKIQKGYTMSPKQIVAGRRMIKRYAMQLVEIADAKNPGWAGEEGGVEKVESQMAAEVAAVQEVKKAADAKASAVQAKLAAIAADESLSLEDLIAASEAAVLGAFQVPTAVLGGVEIVTDASLPASMSYAVIQTPPAPALYQDMTEEQKAKVDTEEAEKEARKAAYEDAEDAEARLAEIEYTPRPAYYPNPNLSVRDQLVQAGFQW